MKINACPICGAGLQDMKCTRPSCAKQWNEQTLKEGHATLWAVSELLGKGDKRKNFDA